ncbi:MAG: hypothetical protein ACYS7Y_20285 [Planctomycetota bacterium]|jgi:hypothetical protein
MKYPTMEEVEAADHVQVARWYRFLKGPGSDAIGKPPEEFKEALRADRAILERVSARLKELGGMTSTISKQIGWDQC